MKVLHISPTFYPATYWGGPIFSTLGLCDALSELENIELRVLTTDSSGPKTNDRLHITDYPSTFNNQYDVYYCKKTLGREFSFSMLWHLKAMIEWADIVHLTYAYSPPTIPTLLICRILNKPIVWSPRGALQRWDGTTKSQLKNIWEKVCNQLIKPNQCTLHLTSEVELHDSQPRIPHASAQLITNGVHIPPTLNMRTWQPAGQLRIMYLGRLHPIKGIENLLQAIHFLDNSNTITLNIYGAGDDNYTQSLVNMVNALNIHQQVIFHGEVGGKNKTQAYQNSDLLIAPSYSENFGMSIAEALAHEVPVIASKGTPWKDLENYDCGLWVNNDAKSIAQAITKLHSRNLEVMGKKGRCWMKASFSWPNIAQTMQQTYSRLIQSQ